MRVHVCSATWRMTNYVETVEAPGIPNAPRGPCLDSGEEFELHGPSLARRCRTKDASVMFGLFFGKLRQIRIRRASRLRVTRRHE